METRKDILKTATRYAQSGEWDKVIKEYLKLLEMEPNDVALHNSLGDAYAKMGDNRKAFENYLKVLGDSATKSNPTKLVFLYKKIAKLDPKKFDLEGKAIHETISRTVRARELYDKQDYEAALPALKEAVMSDKMNPDLYMMLGEVYEKQTDIGNSVEAYVKALRIYFEKERKDEALAIAHKIIKMHKGNTDAIAMIAEDLVKTGKKEEADEMFKDVLINLADKNLIAQGKDIAKRAMDLQIKYGEQFYAYFLFKDNAFDEAKKILESKYDLTLEEKLLLGKIYFKTMDYDKARSMLLSMDPEVINESDELLEQIGDVYLKLRDHKKASEYYLKGVKLLKSREQFDHAILTANKVLNVDGNNIEVYEILADIYTRKQMKNNLIDTYTKLSALYDGVHRTEESMKIKGILAKLKML
jgi:tetratricopeptide (TPR) repeat protein